MCLYIVNRLSPELYLKRPALHGNYWRLDNILERKAVCIVLLTYFVAFLHQVTSLSHSMQVQ